ncbi:MAG: cysteine--tRNA ligase [Anaplasmataceae bacterium]|nr:cysteine--tRNA ligase [Anaplasmataceae bacterium]
MSKSPIRIYNSLTRKTEDLPQRKNSPLRLFVCGLTVYDTPHIGNIRTYTTFDAFVKYLRSQGLEVEYLQNITDVDDKILRRAREENVSWKVIARRYTANYKKILKLLKIDSVNRYAPATSYIKEIEAQVEGLEKKSFVYKIDGDGYYFDIKKFKDYGKLAGRTAEQADDATTRIDDSIQKKNRGDFCVWKLSKDDEPGWKSTLGFGRPGWHIEDTAIAFKFFGSQYEIHGGGVDLKFPHHEAEIALAEALSEKKPYVKLWMHTGHLRVNDTKMSKSLKNFLTIDDFLKEYSGDVFRLMVLGHHYRSPFNYTEETAKDYKKNWETLQEFIWKLDFIAKKSKNKLKGHSKVNEIKTKFIEALNNDFNTPEALSYVYSLDSNHFFKYTPSEAREMKNAIVGSLKSLGLKIDTKSPKIPATIQSLAEKREYFRGHKQFVQADELRKEINELGYLVDDTVLGQFIRPQ